MSIDLNQCDQACTKCIQSYKSKHVLQEGQKFQIRCDGIPEDHIPSSVLSSIDPSDRETARALLDPVAWAVQTLDWYCLDPDGEVWKRKNPNEYQDWMNANPGADILGHSRYHRPYQATMLRCSSKRKVFRIGRQVGKTETLVISMLFHMFTKPDIPEGEGFKIIVITPYQAQIDLIFGRMMQLIRSSPLTQNSLRRNVKAPIYTLELHNESIVRGFTAGTKSGGNAEAVRGQHGHMLVFDEADYLNPSDMDAAMSIITNYPTATVWMSSTPSGKRERFWTTCNSRRYKEYYYPSYANPLWTNDLEDDFREALTELGYVHEVLAKFGEQEQGVFQNVYVQAAKRNYNYGDIKYHRSWTFTVGVDWNDVKNGTTINVLGFNPSTNHFHIVDRHVVSREGWTQLAACHKVAEVNRLWKPIAIYVDSGGPAGGGTQVEVLRKYGWDSLSDPTKGPTHPDSKLRNIIKPYSFGSKIQTRDLFTKQPVDKHAKAFLVESTVRRFEAQDIVFPDSDKSLEDQLLGYIIDHVTPSGSPVYKAGNKSAGDHALDALMLSIVAFVLEVTPLGKPVFSTQVAFTGRIGEMNEPPIYEGDTVIKRDIGRDRQERRDRSRPEGLRAEKMVQQSLFSDEQLLPANNTTHGSGVGIWHWGPGKTEHEKGQFFSGRDVPRPRVRTWTEAQNEARRRIGISPSRASRPRRKNV